MFYVVKQEDQGGLGLPFAIRRLGIVFKLALAALPLLPLMTACQSGGDGAAVDAFLNIGKDFIEVPVPVSLSVSVTTPAEDNKNVGFQTKVGGTCSAPGKTVEIKGGATGLTICGLAGTWETWVDFSSAPVGAVSITVELVNGTERSFAVSKSFVKESTDCDLEADRLKTYANIDSGGDGAGVPWAICTAIQLDKVRLNPTHNFVLKNEIDLEGVPWNPLPQTFSGTFDGNGFSVSNLYINDTASDERALFARVVGSGVIKDLTLTNINIRGKNQVGGLAGRIFDNASFENIKISGRVEGGNNIGGLTGHVNAAAGTTNRFENITLEVNLVGNSSVGGLFGATSDSTGGVVIENISSSGTVVGAGSVGGLVGYFDTPNATLTDVSATGAITASSAAYAGGLVGRLESGTLRRGSATGAVTSQFNTNIAYVGGLIGLSGTGSNIYDSYATGAVSAKSERVGGLVGHFSGSEIFDSYATGNVTVDSEDRVAHYVGGLIGYAISTTLDVRRTRATGTISVSGANQAQQVAGLIGRFDGANLTDSHATGDVTNATSGVYTGGLLGYSNAVAGVNKTISNAYATGTVSAAAAYAGGFAGFLGRANGASGLSVSNCYATGSVTNTSTATDTYTGGFAGRIYGGTAGNGLTLDDLYATGAVTAKNRRVGGFAGEVYTDSTGSTLDADSVYATGNVTVTSDGTSVLYIGGFAGTYYTNNGATRITLNLAYATGNVSSEGGDTGGLVGYFRSGNNAAATLSNSYATGSVSAAGGNTGGLVGNVSTGGPSAMTLSDVYATGTVSSSTGTNVGGLLGQFTIGNSATAYLVENAYATGNVSADGTSVGGLIGYISGGTAVFPTVRYSYARGNVVSANGGYVGGLIGQSRARTTIEYSYATGNVTSASDYAAGLVAGSDQGAQSISASFATGTVTANGSGRFVGGLAGRWDSSTIYNSFTTSDVYGSRDVGSIVGYASTATDNSFNFCYSTGRVYRLGGAFTSFGPLVGTLNNALRFGTGMFFNSDTSLVTDVPSGNALAPTANGNSLSLTTAQMSDSNNFAANFTGYDFAGSDPDDWEKPSANYVLPGGSGWYLYPILEWME